MVYGQRETSTPRAPEPRVSDAQRQRTWQSTCNALETVTRKRLDITKQCQNIQQQILKSFQFLYFSLSSVWDFTTVATRHLPEKPFLDIFPSGETTIINAVAQLSTKFLIFCLLLMKTGNNNNNRVLFQFFKYSLKKKKYSISHFYFLSFLMLYDFLEKFLVVFFWG